jgi:hypothetical protein
MEQAVSTTDDTTKVSRRVDARDAEQVDDANLIREMALFVCKAGGPDDPDDLPRTVAALVGAIILIASRAVDPIGALGCAQAGLDLARRVAVAVVAPTGQVPS